MNKAWTKASLGHCSKQGENCMMTTYVRNGKLIVEITDGRTVDIMRREKQQDEGNIQ